MMSQAMHLLSLFMLCLITLCSGCASAPGTRGGISNRYVVNADIKAPTLSCSASQDPKVWGVIIGINDYQDEGITDLKGSVPDAWIMYHYLTSPQGGGVPAGQLRLLLNHEATRANVEGAIGNFLGQSCPQDRILIYFAGHGAPEPGLEENAFLLVHDTQLSNMVGSAISMQRLPEFLKWRTKDVGELLLIVDACHSGNILFPNQRGVKKPPNVAARERSSGITKSVEALGKEQGKWSVISSAAANQYAGELVGECGSGVEYAGGIFTCHMLTALKGASDLNGDGSLSTTELFKYVYSKVSKETGGLQTPTFSGSSDDNVPFFKAPQSQQSLEIPRIPAEYASQTFQSGYKTARWTGIALTVLSGALSAYLASKTNTITADLNRFNYRSRTSQDYNDLVREREDMTRATNISYGLTGVTSLATIVFGLLEYYDRPEGRQEVYLDKPWLTFPSQQTSSVGATFNFKIKF